MTENIIKVHETIKEISQELHLNGVENTQTLNNGEKFFDNSNQLSKKRIRKKCFGCLDNFTCSQAKNYDYCSSCSLNGSQYLNKDSPCSECDGSGLIKFKNQLPRSCKLCYLAKQKEKNIFTKDD
jgi:hypothetical protein